MEIFEINPTVVYKNTLDYVFTDAQKKFLHELSINESLLSDQLYLLNDTRFYSLKNIVRNHIFAYGKEVCGFGDSLFLEITQSWYRKTKPGENHDQHNHPNSCLSGVIYVNVPEKSRDHAGINFNTAYHPFKNFQFEYDIQNPNKYNTKVTHVPVKTGDIILFPSWMDHYVLKNEDPENSREIISFNTFLRGNISVTTKYPTTIII